MGWAVGSVLADISLTKLEVGRMGNIVSSVDFYSRYMDNIIVICSSESDPNILLIVFSGAYSTTKFTIQL